MGTVGICTRSGERPEGRKEGWEGRILSQTRNTVHSSEKDRAGRAGGREREGTAADETEQCYRCADP